MSWLARLDAFLARSARERSEASERSRNSGAWGVSPEAEDAKEAPAASALPGPGTPSFAVQPAPKRAEAREEPFYSHPSLPSRRQSAALLLRAAMAGAEAFAGREPDPIEEAEREAIQSEPELPPEGTAERERLDREHRATVRRSLGGSALLPDEPPPLPDPAVEDL